MESAGDLSVDSAIGVDDNIYYFCSDQYRTFLIIAHNIVNASGTTETKFSICLLSYNRHCDLIDRLVQNKFEHFYNAEFQADLSSSDIIDLYRITEDVSFIPENNFSFCGPNKIYNWEIFFHVPYLIADLFNQNRKFEEAQKWYHFIFNPYNDGQTADWIFRPFQQDINDWDLIWQNFIDDPEDAEIWVNDPYSPHALARVRPGTYQKAIILAYIDNLLDWADQEFTRDTRNSINRAISFYNTAKDLLKLHEIQHDEACNLFIKELKAVIRTAVPRNRKSQLLEKSGKLGRLPENRIEELLEDIKDIINSLYSPSIKANIIENRLDAAIEEVNDIPWTNLEDITQNLETYIDCVFENAEDYINSVDDESICVCIPKSWIIQEEPLYPPIRLLNNSITGCIPENPLYQNYRNHIESNLRKIHSCRNIAGVQRILPIYEAAVDPMAIVKAVGSGADLGDLSFSNASGIGPYRFGYLIERAKSLANLVVQAGNALLLAIEKKESEELAYLRAQQELKLLKANVHLRKLGEVEADDNFELASKQWERANEQFTHFDNLINNGKIHEENKALEMLDWSIGFQIAAATLHAASGVMHLIPNTTTSVTSGGVTYGGANIGSSLSAFATMSSTIAGVFGTYSSKFSMEATYERRKQEWQLQKTLAVKDREIATVQKDIAMDRIAIAEMEREIAEMQSEFADQTLEFLKEKFTNKELYSWMMKELSKILYGFYNLAYTTARMAQATLEFERNESLDIIQYAYWDSEKKGLLSGDKLLLDINRLDDNYINNNARKLEITKHVSLASLAPEAIVDLKTNGKTSFRTPMSWFDRDFPGHYQRIIKSVRLSVLALIGPTAGINATLSTTSNSLVVLDPLDPEPRDVPRIQSVALSAPSNASGLFELNYRDERYLPFEGCGVDVTWELEMPKASNRFDFNSIVDLILTIDYTAIPDSEYKRRIIEELGTETGGMLPVSFQYAFPDSWYHFHNPIWLPPGQAGVDPYEKSNTPKPYSLKFVIAPSQFPPNEENHLLERITIRFSLTDNTISIPIKRISILSDNGLVFSRSNRLTGGEGDISFDLASDGLLPFGTWEIEIDRDSAPGQLWKKDKEGQPVMEDITAATSRHVLDTEKISDVILAITYSAELDWPPAD